MVHGLLISHTLALASFIYLWHKSYMCGLPISRTRAYVVLRIEMSHTIHLNTSKLALLEPIGRLTRMIILVTCVPDV